MSMKLFSNGRCLGDLHDYSYETPWAYGFIKPLDEAEYQRLCQASYVINVVIEEDWGDLTADEETAVYNQRLAQLGITDADIDQFQRSEWEIRNADNHDRNGHITLAECTFDGLIRWRYS